MFTAKEKRKRVPTLFTSKWYKAISYLMKYCEDCSNKLISNFVKVWRSKPCTWLGDITLYPFQSKIRKDKPYDIYKDKDRPLMYTKLGKTRNLKCVIDKKSLPRRIMALVSKIKRSDKTNLKKSVSGVHI